MSANKIGNNVGQNKKYIDMEVNSLLMGSGSNKSRATGEPKEIREFKMGDHKENKPEKRIPLNVWRMLTPKARLVMKSG